MNLYIYMNPFICMHTCMFLPYIQIAWGTHEKYPPKGTHYHDATLASPWRHAVPNAQPNRGNCIALSQPGIVNRVGGGITTYMHT